MSLVAAIEDLDSKVVATPADVCCVMSGVTSAVVATNDVFSCNGVGFGVTDDIASGTV